ncbi:ABC transporter permease [Candidatus Uhrbacteria bacterium]|nr:ABC transporter permease [Candidatus Uhrbacteria bacterium]
MTAIDLAIELGSALTSNKVRTGLTVLGIVIGIGSVIAMVSIGQGGAKSIESSIQGLGSNLLTVSPGALSNARGGVSTGRGMAPLSIDDASAIAGIAGVAAVSPELNRRFQMTSSLGNNTNSNVIGVESGYLTARSLAIDAGTFITSQHNAAFSRVAVLGPTTVKDLFGDADPIGKTIRINRMDFRVIGTTVAKGSSGFFNPDDTAFVPLETMQRILVGADVVSTIAVSVADKTQMADVKAQVTELLASRHRVDPAAPDFSIFSQEDVLGTLNQVTNTFTMFLGSVAGISLVVGGIGIMNMMLMTITERTREIGLRRAIGAKQWQISLQFLAESVALTLLGGILGILLGWLLSLLVTTFAGINTSVTASSVVLGVGMSSSIGIIFGFYPARRAGKLHPIDALRYE